MVGVNVSATSGGHWLDVMESLVTEAEVMVQERLGFRPELSLICVQRDEVAVPYDRNEGSIHHYEAEFEVIGRRQ